MKKIFFCFVIAILSLFLTSAHAADEKKPLLLVEWSDLGGDVIIPGYEGYSSDTTDFSMGISNDCSVGVPCGNFDGAVITKYASPIGVRLAEYCALGKILDKVTIVSLDINKKPAVPLWKISFSPGFISKISSAVNSTDGRLMEAIDLITTQIQWHFYTYNEKDELTDHQCIQWNVGDGIFDCSP
jgi:type VI protein secretion system component Hcp